MAQLEAASRIVDIQGQLAESFLGTPTRAELMAKQGQLWDEHFFGKPYEEVARQAWMHKTLFRW